MDEVGEVNNNESILLCYTRGNECFNSGDVESALSNYSKAIQDLTMWKKEFTILGLKLMVNRSLCYIKMRLYDQALSDCSRIINFYEANDRNPTLDTIFVKARIRRAMVYEYLGDFSKGIEDLNAIKLDAGSRSGGLTKFAHDLKARLCRLANLDTIASTIEGKPPRLVSDSQSLRLILMSSVPEFLTINQPFSVKLCITNEFGRWDRSLIQFDHFLTGSESETGSSWNQIEFSIILLKDITIPTNVLSLQLLPSSPAVDSGGKAEFSVSVCMSSAEAEIPDLNEVRAMVRFSLAGPLPSGALVQPLLTVPLPIVLPNHMNHTVCSSSSSSNSNEVKNAKETFEHANCVREVILGSNPTKKVFVYESTGFLGIGGKVWDSAYVLLDFLTEFRETFIAGATVVELGSGTGLAGIAINSLGAERVLLTDLEEVVPLLEANISLNDCGAKVFARRLAWGSDEDLSRLVEEDLAGTGLDRLTVVASDVVYAPEGYEPLASSIRKLLSLKVQTPNDGGIVMIMAHRHRNPDDGQFFQLLAESSPEVRVVNMEYSRRTSVTHNCDDVKIFKLFI